MSGFHAKDLIAEIKCRPGIYNKDLLEHPRRESKHQLWLEVGEKLTPRADWALYSEVEKDARIDEIQAKWKHLKDHFYREIKVIQNGSAKKRKYVYFDDMEFMRPYVGLKLPPAGKGMHDSADNSPVNTSQEDFKMNDPDYVMEELLKSNDSNDEDVKETPVSVSAQRRQSQRVIKPTAKAMVRRSQPATPRMSKEQLTPAKAEESSKKTQQAQQVSNNHVISGASSAGNSGSSGNTSLKIRDGDISFCLSLVPTFRKLNDSSKLRAKIEVLKILHKFVEHVERKNNAADVQGDDNDLIQEDIIHDDDGDLDEAISVKNEQHNDPLNHPSGNTKAWWT